MVPQPTPSCLLPALSLSTLHYEDWGGGSKRGGLSDKRPYQNKGKRKIDMKDSGRNEMTIVITRIYN